MPLLEHRGYSIDYSDTGTGPPVVLIHSSVSGNRQWHALTETLSQSYRVLAPNLFGYGDTPAWAGTRPQTLADQAALVAALADFAEAPVHLVGHSLGGAIAMKAALFLGERARRLVLIEPNPFYLLKLEGCEIAYAEILALCTCIRDCAVREDWGPAARAFANYWLGEGAWDGMPERRQAAFLKSLPPNLHEWDGVLNETTPLAGWRHISARTLLLHSRGTRRPIAEIVALLSNACPDWQLSEVSEGGHMAPLNRPDLVNPLIADFLGDRN